MEIEKILKISRKDPQQAITGYFPETVESRNSEH